MPTLPGRARASRWSVELEGRAAADVVAWAVREFGPGLVIGSSFGKDGLVVVDLARRHRADIPVLFLDTGYHFPETLEFREQLRRAWGANVVDVRPSLTVPEHEAAHGDTLFADDPDRCCRLRKVEPLLQALAGRAAWMTGVRRSQHASRGATPVVEWQELPDGGGVYKVNPLVAWSLGEVEAYLRTHGIPPHPLWALGYRSVGCAPCTSPVAPGEQERAGRWRGRGKVECGIHVVGVHSGPVPASAPPTPRSSRGN